MVDDFYADPDRVRALALERGDWSPQKTDEGRTYDAETYNSFAGRGVAEAFGEILGIRVRYEPAVMGFGVFAFTGESANVPLTTHYDDTDWAGIVYLVPPGRCDGGLSFFRHRDSGLLGPPDDAKAVELGYDDREHWMKDVYFPDKVRPEAWEEMSRVSMVYNRLVLLRGGTRFHRASSGFGTSPADGRLTQRFFFDEERAS
ncbi:DUF6445 family protein [Streptomyces sp. S07_1.15]|uniref:DUF6445 family protein n=1 Tax=Streptomyces sp. S07_1.15 TaxID=2873925 RepID=UPI001D149ABE|nr:DUF6445 family protein [Streptomyces sp. S07_1.15]MCC3655698.1 DUF6445 family protein [Streptomyces sp. S07_1.15]